MTQSSLTDALKMTPLSCNKTLQGALQLLSAYQAQNIESLKSTILTFNTPSILAQVYIDYPTLCDKPDEAIFNSLQLDNYETQYFDSLYEHLRYLQLEFIGQSELNFYHTLLIVLMRRGYDVELTFKLFESLWQTQADYLYRNLTLRWLVSAADTFIDFCHSPLRRAILMNVVSLINTLKVYETQQYLLTDNVYPDEKKVERFYAKHQGLYDGLTFLRLGSDDTIEQMRRRFLAFRDEDAFATQFLLTVFDRLHDNPTAYAFFKRMHTEDWGYQWLRT